MGPRDDLDRRLGEMLDDVPPHDDRPRRQTLLALDATPQRRGRWPSPLLGRRSAQLAPAALTMALGVVLAGLVGVLAWPMVAPADPGGSAPLVAPLDVGGRLLCSPTDARTGTTEELDIGAEPGALVRRETRGFIHPVTIVEMSDPRLDGTVTWAWDEDEYRDASPSAARVGTGTLRIENDAGAWEGSFRSVHLSGAGWATVVLPLAGEGAYIGRMALWELDYEPDMPEGRCGWHVRGLVIAADDLPAVPEAAGP